MNTLLNTPFIYSGIGSSKMNMPFVSYSPGTGGRWLSHLLWALETNYTKFPEIKKINFHTGRITSYFKIGHNDSGDPSDYTFGGLCKFNLFLNSWIKFRAADDYQQFNSRDPGQQVYILSNDVYWRFGQKYANTYDKKIDLDYANIFLDTAAFRDQLLSILESHWPKEYIPRLTQSFVDEAARAFRLTVVNTEQHLGNVESIGWLGWCHAMCLLNDVNVPINIGTHVDEYKAWLLENQNWIIEKTRTYIL